MVVHPSSIWFIHGVLENDRLVVKKKEYEIVSYTYKHDGNQSQFQEVFTDVVLYLWNTFYETAGKV